MPGLFSLVTERKSDTTAIVGMTKNVGKTVTFNYLVSEFERTKATIGLLSAGYDGERFDRITLKEKPRIYAPVGSLIATARACHEAADAELELIEAGPLSTPLGAVCLARVIKSGLVELAGPGSVSGLNTVIARMKQNGASHILVDGAINRLASASPLVSGSTILATGASLGPTMDDVIRKTVYRCTLLNSPPVNDRKLNFAARDGLTKGSAAIIEFDGSDYRVEAVEAPIPLLAGVMIKEMCRSDTTALVFGGALVDSILDELLESFKQLPVLIVQDATRLFVTADSYYRYTTRGGKIMVLDHIDLLAVTLNPTEPGGGGYDPAQFLNMMTEALKPCPVFDLVFEA